MMVTLLCLIESRGKVEVVTEDLFENILSDFRREESKKDESFWGL